MCKFKLYNVWMHVFFINAYVHRLLVGYISPWHLGVFMMHSIYIYEVFAYTQHHIIWHSVQEFNVAVTDCFNRDTTELQSLILLCILTACVSMCVPVWFPRSSVSTVTFCEWQCTIKHWRMVKNVLHERLKIGRLLSCHCFFGVAEVCF